MRADVGGIAVQTLPTAPNGGGASAPIMHTVVPQLGGGPFSPPLVPLGLALPADRRGGCDLGALLITDFCPPEVTEFVLARVSLDMYALLLQSWTYRNVVHQHVTHQPPAPAQQSLQIPLHGGIAKVETSSGLYHNGGEISAPHVSPRHIQQLQSPTMPTLHSPITSPHAADAATAAFIHTDVVSTNAQYPAMARTPAPPRGGRRNLASEAQTPRSRLTTAPPRRGPAPPTPQAARQWTHNGATTTGACSPAYSNSTISTPGSSPRRGNEGPSPQVAKIRVPWSVEEDELLRQLVASYGFAWKRIADGMSNRSTKACRERWHNYVEPSLRHDSWTASEDAILIAVHQELGNSWAAVAQRLPGRSAQAVKNRMHVLEKGNSTTTPTRYYDQDSPNQADDSSPSHTVTEASTPGGTWSPSIALVTYPAVVKADVSPRYQEPTQMAMTRQPSGVSVPPLALPLLPQFDTSDDVSAIDHVGVNDDCVYDGMSRAPYSKSPIPSGRVHPHRSGRGRGPQGEAEMGAPEDADTGSGRKRRRDLRSTDSLHAAHPFKMPDLRCTPEQFRTGAFAQALEHAYTNTTTTMMPHLPTETPREMQPVAGGASVSGCGVQMSLDASLGLGDFPTAVDLSHTLGEGGDAGDIELGQIGGSIDDSILLSGSGSALDALDWSSNTPLEDSFPSPGVSFHLPPVGAIAPPATNNFCGLEYFEAQDAPNCDARSVA